jgi:hypothetical protein
MSLFADIELDLDESSTCPGPVAPPSALALASSAMSPPGHVDLSRVPTAAPRSELGRRALARLERTHRHLPAEPHEADLEGI